jgi:hypothetical protein
MYVKPYLQRIVCIIQNGPWKSSLPSISHCKSLCYIRYTSTWLDVRSCVLMQQTTTFNIFHDGISFQHLATALISVCTLCYGPELLFCGPPCISVYSIMISTCAPRMRHEHVSLLWFDDTNKILCRVQIMNLLTTQKSISSCSLLSLWYKHSPQQPDLKHFSSTFFPYDNG